MRSMLLIATVASFSLTACATGAFAQTAPSSLMNETTSEMRFVDDSVRVVINTPANFDAAKPTQVLIFALPNGNTIEQTMGSKLATGMHWRYDIQHVAAQTRKLRTLFPERNIVLACVEANNLSWPAWRKDRPENAKLIRGIVDGIVKWIPGDQKSIALTCHSGGGSFLFGFINGGETIPENIDRIAWLDANYSYTDEDKHGDKILAWLKGDAKRELVVIAYDDRNITLDGKKVVSDTGGTFRASQRMIERFSNDIELPATKLGEFEERIGMNGQIHFLIHGNAENKILHTVLVERNGLIEAMTLGTPIERKWGGSFWGGRAYSEFITLGNDAGPTTQKNSMPPRPDNAPGGEAFAEQIADLPAQAREQAIVQEVLRGNVPKFLRAFVPVKVSLKAEDGKTYEAVFEVMPDYLAIGSDSDFIRMPMTPRSATQIASAFRCMLPTRKLVNDIYAQAEVKLTPEPMTESRESMETFVAHDALIETQRGNAPLGKLVAGIKKDVVLTNRLKEKPARVAIYGWHEPDGKPIQPLTIVHGEGYVDYSHGIRLIRDRVMVDGKKMSLDALLRDVKLCELVSDEGVIDARYEP